MTVAMSAASGDTHEGGRRLIQRLKDYIERLTQQLHDSQAQNTNCAFDETNEVALNLCETIEVTLTHGIKIREFNGNIPLWGFLERLEILTPPCIPLRNTVGAVASISTLRNPIARARAWVRQILNEKHVDESVMFMMAQTMLLKSFYFPGAMLLNPELGVALVREKIY